MKLNEKIYLCRKKAGLSQDALAPISVDGVSKPFWRNEGDLRQVAFARWHHSNAQ